MPSLRTSGSGRPSRRSGDRQPAETPRGSCQAGYSRPKANGADARLHSTDMDARSEPTRRSLHRAAPAGSGVAADTLMGVGAVPAAPNSDRKSSFARIHNRLSDPGTLNNCGGESSELVRHAFARQKRQTGISAKPLNHDNERLIRLMEPIRRQST